MRSKSDKKLIVEAFFIVLTLVVIVIAFSFLIANAGDKDIQFDKPLQPISNEVLPPTENGLEQDIKCLALNIYHEARSDNLAGRVAVADVVLNRVRDNRYPNNICDVVKQAKLSQWWLDNGREVPIRNQCQFSWWCDGLSDEPTNSSVWEESLLIATNLLIHNEYRGITEGATHYHATYVNPRWIKDRGMHVIGRIGEHIFYRWG